MASTETPVRWPARVYDAVFAALPWICGAVITAIFVLILVDVSIRSLGGQPPAGTVTLELEALAAVTARPPVRRPFPS